MRIPELRFQRSIVLCYRAGVKTEIPKPQPGSSVAAATSTSNKQVQSPRPEKALSSGAANRSSLILTAEMIEAECPGASRITKLSTGPERLTAIPGDPTIKKRRGAHAVAPRP